MTFFSIYVKIFIQFFNFISTGESNMALNSESSCSYSCCVGMDMLTGYGFMKPYGYQSLIMDVAERHLRQFGLGVDNLIKKGMSWVLVSSSVEILEPVRAEIALNARTWHSEQNRLTFRRELCFTDTNYILIEFPTDEKPYGLTHTVVDIINRGYQPILAHVERYPYFTSDPTRLYDLVEKGCIVQINAGAII